KNGAVPASPNSDTADANTRLKNSHGDHETRHRLESNAEKPHLIIDQRGMLFTRAILWSKDKTVPPCGSPMKRQGVV
ncbi:MAG: hypothetical protein WCH83_17385, partial [Alphaproteobacteria bacterium]